MALAAVAPPSVAPLGKFVGDSEGLLHQLVAACERKPQADPSLVGRDLQPFDFTADAAAASTGGKGGKSKKSKSDLARVASGSSSGSASQLQQQQGNSKVIKAVKARASSAAPSKKQQSQQTQQAEKGDGGAKRTRTGAAASGGAKEASNCSMAKGAKSRAASPKPRLVRTPSTKQQQRPKTPGSTLANGGSVEAAAMHKSKSFAGPGFCNSPGPEALPLPPSSLLLRRD